MPSPTAASAINESIYNLITEDLPSPNKKNLYHSQYGHNIPPTASTFGASISSVTNVTNVGGNCELGSSKTKNINAIHRHNRPHANFGPKEDLNIDPKNFQHKHSHPKLVKPSKFVYESTMKPKLDAHVPTTFNKSLTQRTNISSDDRNFIAENALSAIRMSPKGIKPEPISYINKADYGKIPAYLNTVKSAIVGERETVRRMIEEEKERYANPTHTQSFELNEDDRLSLLSQLKQRWGVVNSAYQTITHITTLDTAGKVRRKEEYERELAEIEKHIEKLSKPHIVIVS